MNIAIVWYNNIKSLEKQMLNLPMCRDGRFKQLSNKKYLCEQAYLNCLRRTNENI